MKLRLRKKGKYANGKPHWAIERYSEAGAKWISLTLPPLNDVYEWACQYRNDKKVSRLPQEEEEKVREKGAYELLSEPEEPPKNLTQKELWELTK